MCNKFILYFFPFPFFEALVVVVWTCAVVVGTFVSTVKFCDKVLVSVASAFISTVVISSSDAASVTYIEVAWLLMFSASSSLSPLETLAGAAEFFLAKSYALVACT